MDNAQAPDSAHVVVDGQEQDVIPRLRLTPAVTVHLSPVMTVHLSPAMTVHLSPAATVIWHPLLPQFFKLQQEQLSF